MQVENFIPNTSEYAHLTQEERKIWRNDNFPKMTQNQVFNFYFEVIAPLEAEFGEDAIAKELEQDYPDLEKELNQLEQEYENTQQQYEQLSQSKASQKQLQRLDSNLSELYM